MNLLYEKSMKTRWYIVCAFIFIYSCALSPEPSDISEGQIIEEMEFATEYYSIHLKSTDRWEISKIVEKNDGIILNRHKQPPNCRIMVIRKIVDHDLIAGASAQELADAIRNREKQGLIELGVKKGLYNLPEIAMGDEVIGDKIYYSMNYTTTPIQDWGYEDAGLYLYFPKETGNEYYILAHFSQTFIHNKPSGPSCRPDFISILESLKIK